jgi:hypothetical protein
VGALCQAYCAGTEETRQLVLTAPLLVLRAQAVAEAPREKTPLERLLGDLGILAGVARRARTLVDHEAPQATAAAPSKRLRLALQAARAETAALFDAIPEPPQEAAHARPGDPHGDPRAA